MERPGGAADQNVTSDGVRKSVCLEGPEESLLPSEQLFVDKGTVV